MPRSLLTSFAKGILLLGLIGCDGKPPGEGPIAGPATAPEVPSRGAVPATASTSTDEDLLKALRLGVTDLAKELSETGRVERRREGASAPDGHEKPADVLVRNRIRTRLWNDAVLAAESIDVDVKDGSVTLTGRVGSIVEVQRALLASFRVRDVTTVTARLSVR